MTHHTEAERALSSLRHLYQQMAGGMVKDSAQAKRIAEGLLSPAIARLEQAARRAPAAPVPQRRPTLDEVEQALGYHCSAWDCVDPTDLVDAILNLAAAPQPPEAESKVSQGHFDAAQVQMPEPAGCVVYANGESHYWDANRECAELFASSERSRGAPHADGLDSNLHRAASAPATGSPRHTGAKHMSRRARQRKQRDEEKHQHQPR